MKTETFYITNYYGRPIEIEGETAIEAIRNWAEEEYIDDEITVTVKSEDEEEVSYTIDPVYEISEWDVREE